MQVVDANGNVFGQGLEITGIDGKPKVPIINTDITIGTTAIIGGVDGRILFQGTGGVVQESGNLEWDITNSRITINTTTGGPAAIFKNATNGLTITPTSTKVSVYSDYFGAGTDKMLILGTYANQANQLSLFTTGNIGVNTAIDSGFKFDVAGTIRSTGVITGYQFNSSYNGGSYSSIGVNVLDYGDGLRIGYSGSVQKITLFTAAGTPRISVINNGCVGFTNSAPTANIHTSLSITAASAIGRGVYFNNTLTASANNDVLIGLDVLPTFTNGAFTGVTNYAARFGGDVYFGYGNRTLGIQPPSSSANGGAITILGGNATTSGTGGSVNIYGGIGAGGGGRGAINIGQVGYSTVNLGGYIYINNSGPNTGTAVQISAGGQNGLNIYWDNLTPFMQYGLVSGRQSRFVNSSSYTFSSKVFIATNVDSGFTFDVNGTSRFTQALTVNAGGIKTESGTIIGQTGVNSGRMTMFSLNNTGGGYLAAVNSSLAIGFQNRASGGLWSADFIELKVYDNGSTTSTTGYNFYTHNQQSQAASAILAMSINGQSVGVGIEVPNTSAKVQIDSTTQGFLPPRMTNAQMVAIATPAAGLQVFDTTNNKMCVYDGTAWQNLY
jgi:hypothetical protein